MRVRDEIVLKKTLSHHVGYEGCFLDIYARPSFNKYIAASSGRCSGYFVIFLDCFFNEYTTFIPDGSPLVKMLKDKYKFFSLCVKVQKYKTYQGIKQSCIAIHDYDDSPIYKPDETLISELQSIYFDIRKYGNG